MDALLRLHPWLLQSYHSKNTQPLSSLKPDAKKKVIWKCTLKPRHRYLATVQQRLRSYSFTNHNGCPRCIYYGEENLCEWLRSQNITYDREVKLFGLSRFDVMLTDAPYQKILLEVDGKQHFVGSKKYGSAVENRRRDIVKMKQAFAGGYHVIRIHQEDLLDKSSFDWKTTLADTLLLCCQTTTGPSLFLIASSMSIYDKHIQELI